MGENAQLAELQKEERSPIVDRTLSHTEKKIKVPTNSKVPIIYILFRNTLDIYKSMSSTPLPGARNSANFWLIGYWSYIIFLWYRLPSASSAVLVINVPKENIYLNKAVQLFTSVFYGETQGEWGWGSSQSGYVFLISSFPIFSFNNCLSPTQSLNFSFVQKRPHSTGVFSSTRLDFNFPPNSFLGRLHPIYRLSIDQEVLNTCS